MVGGGAALVAVVGLVLAVLGVIGRGLPLLALPDHAPLGVRALEVGAGIAIVATGSAYYLGAALGPGPRDGLMTGIRRATGRPLALIRGAIEVTALVVGIVLGGTFGAGTVAFALLIGPAVANALRIGKVPH
jgi:uncharacterized membrane protein YczE